MYRPIKKAIINPKGNSAKTFDWSKVIGHNFTDDGEVAYPLLGYYPYETKHYEFSADQNAPIFPLIDTVLDSASSEYYVGKVYLPNLNDTNFHSAVMVNSMVPFKNLVPATSHIAPSATENGSIVPFTDYFAGLYDRYRVISFDLECEFTINATGISSDDYGTTVFRGGLLLIDEEVAIATGTAVEEWKTQAMLNAIIDHRYRSGTFKTVPFSFGAGQNRSGVLRMKANVIDQFLNKTYSHITPANTPASGTPTAPTIAGPYNVKDMANYMGILSDGQAAMAAESHLPKIRLWCMPFCILTQPSTMRTGSALTADLQIGCAWKLKQHVQMSTPIRYKLIETQD